MLLKKLKLLKRNKEIILLNQAKAELEIEIKPLEEKMENIKREMFENTKKQDKVERNLTSIKAGEEATEEEIRILEKRLI